MIVAGKIFIIMLVCSFGLHVRANKIPNFLPEYYKPALSINNVELDQISHTTTNLVKQSRYRNKDDSLELLIEWIPCDSSQSENTFDYVLNYIETKAETLDGRYHVLEKNNAYAVIKEQEMTHHFFIFRLQHGVLSWTYSMDEHIRFDENLFDKISFLVNRQRYTEALNEGNVAFGKWEADCYAYATELWHQNNSFEALSVFNKIITTYPYHYDAHLNFIKLTQSPSAATNSAKIVRANSEDQKQIKEAEDFLGIDSSSLNQLPFLEQGEKGLQVILIALPPCNIQLIKEAGEIYQRITDIPVKLCRLKEKWSWQKPERFKNKRIAEQLLVHNQRNNIDFTDWSKNQYIEALKDLEQESGMRLRFLINKIILEMGDASGQYRVNHYLNNLCEILSKYRSSDKQTMYVGITENNIFSDNNNFIFSQGRVSGASLASVLSYHMMQAHILHEEYAFRPRLAERLAKEIVPASLKQLNIPRSSDPRCPYSYSSGINRLDEKTLTLSEPIKTALNDLKGTN